MTIIRSEQQKLARLLLPIIKHTEDAEELESLCKLTELFKSWVEDNDNGIVYDLAEYAYEKLQVLQGKKESGWGEEALISLEKQLNIEE